MAASREQWPAQGLEAVPVCPVCEGEDRTLLFADLTDRIWFTASGQWSLFRCGSCSAAYLDPRPTRATIGRAYSSYYTHSAPAEMPRRSAGLRAALMNGYLNRRYGYDFVPASGLGPVAARLLPKRRAYADRLVRHLRRNAGGRLLDVGCGSGEFLALMQAAGWDAEGLEPDQAAAVQARRSGVRVATAALEDADFSAGSFDAITMSHVIEHMHDPVGAFRICRRLVRRNGLLWIATPNLDAFGRTLFGRDWIGLDPPRHLVLFTRSSLTRSLTLAGFRIRRFFHDYSAERVFPCSAAVAAGDDLRDSGIVRRHRSSLRIAAADLVGRIAPGRAEELVLLAEPA